MAGTIHQPWLMKSPEEEDWQYQHKRRKSQHRSSCKEYVRDQWDNHGSKAGPAYPEFKQKITKEPLWIDCWYNPSSVGEENKKSGSAVLTQDHDGQISAKNEKVIHDRALLRNNEGIAFAALLKACAKNKD
eukprot:c24989_g15_i1 orf=171-563(+)